MAGKKEEALVILLTKEIALHMLETLSGCAFGIESLFKKMFELGTD